VVFWFHVGHLLSSEILLVLLLGVHDVILNFSHWLLHRRLAVHLLLDHSMYLLLLLIAENAILAMVLASHHSLVGILSIIMLWNSHLLHRPSLRTSNLACLLPAAVLIEFVPESKQHPFNCFRHHFYTVLDIFGRSLQT
jgi:hypothetical protein